MMNKPTKYFSHVIRYLLSGLFTVTLLGCGAPNSDNTNTAIIDSTSIRNKSMVYCAEGAPETFNPQLVTSAITIDATSNQIYNRLLEYQTSDNTLGPALANSWHVTRDSKMITFYLRKEISFQTTEYFTPTRFLNADDVIFSFNRILQTDHPYHGVGGGKYPFFESVNFSGLIKEIEKINDYTIRFKLNYPDSSFLANLASDFAVILSKEYADQLALNNNKKQIDILPIGTGPFKFKEYSPGAVIRYYKNENYWRHPVNVDQLLFDITTSNTGRLTKLLTNECDVIAYPIAHNEIEQHPELSLQHVTSFNVAYLAFNTNKKPFDNPLVRKAISHAINKPAIIKSVYGGRATIADTLLPVDSWAHSDDIASLPFSIALAKAFLIEAGLSDGFEMDLWAMPVQRAYNPNALKMAKLVQADLAKIGITVKIVSYEWATFLRKLAAGEHQTAMIGWSADHPDPDNFFTPLLSCTSATAGNNRTFWCNEEFDQLIKNSLLTTNVHQRKQLYYKAQQIIADQVPLFPIAHSQRYQARNKSVTGKILNPFGGIDFSKVSKN